LLAGCGSGQEVGYQGGPAAPVTLPAASAARFSGKVLDPSGVGQSGVLMQFEERTTNARVELVTGADGTYSAELPSGVYDVGLEQAGVLTTATCYYGPVIVGGAGQRDFTLRSAAGHGPTEVFGTLSVRPGTHYANQRLVISPGSSRNEGVPEASETITDARGAFNVEVGGQLDLDLDVFESDGSPDQHLDVIKFSDKPCYVEFVTDGSSVENRLRCTEVDGPTEIAARVRKKGVDQQFFAHADFLDDGLLTHDTSFAPFPCKSIIRPETLGNLEEFMKERLINEEPTRHLVPAMALQSGGIFFKYSILVRNDVGSNWTFYDQSGDSYSLAYINTLIWHEVAYNSQRPYIHKITLGRPAR